MTYTPQHWGGRVPGAAGETNWMGYSPKFSTDAGTVRPASA